MSININNLKLDLQAIIADLPQVITYKGQTYSVICDDLAEGRDLDLMGYEGNSSLMFYADANDFSDQPKHNDIITYLAKEYKVERVEIGADTVGLKIFCTSKTR
jgi:hypothetical protein